MKDIHVKLANDALLRSDFNEFFSELKVIDPSERNTLVMQAIEIAFEQRNVDLLKQLFSVELKWINRDRIIEVIIQKLILLNELDVAVSLVVLQDDNGQGWVALIKELIMRDDLDKVKKFYPYLKTPEQKKLIAESCLSSSSREKIFVWLEWFEQYAQIATDVNEETIEFVSSRLATHEKFPEICDRLKKLPDSPNKNYLLRKIYLDLLLRHEHTRCAYFEDRVLSDALNWLADVRKVQFDDQYFDVFEKLEYEEARVFLFTATVNLCKKHFNSEDKIFIENIKIAAARANKHFDIVLEISCEKCLEDKRFDVIIALLPYFDDFGKSEILEELLEYELNVKQYETILNKLEKLDSCWYLSILKKIPASLIEIEKDKRVQKLIDEANQEFYALKGVHGKTESYARITQVVDKLIDYKRYKAAHEFCKKLVPSNARDRYIFILFRAALQEKRFLEAEEIVHLFVQKQDRQALESYLAHYRRMHYRKALKGLKKVKHTHEFIDLMHDCVDKILQEEKLKEAISFLVTIGMFSVHEMNEEKSIKLKIIRAFLKIYNTDENLCKLIDDLMRQKVENIETYLVKEFLEKDKIIPVMYLLNQEVTKHRSDLEDIVENYLEKCGADINLLKAIAILENDSLKQQFIRVLFYGFFTELTEKKLKLIVAIPVESLRITYMNEAMTYYVLHDQFREAMIATKYLSEDKKMWSDIIRYASQSKFHDLVMLFLEKCIDNPHLFNWAVEQWLVDDPIDDLANWRKFYELLQELQTKQSKNAAIGWHQEFWVMQHMYTTIFKRALYYWSQSILREKAYQKFIATMTQVLYEQESDCYQSYLLDSIKEMFKEMSEGKFYEEALLAVQLLIDYETHFTDTIVFREFWKKLLSENMLDVAIRLIELIPLEKQSHLREQFTLEVSEKYFSSNDYKQMLIILEPYQQSIGTIQKIVQWTIQFIEKDKPDVANIFISKFLDLKNNSASEHHFIEIVEKFIAHGFVISANKYLQTHIQMPGTKLRLQGKLQEAYIKYLEKHIGKEQVENLLEIQQSLCEFLRISNDREKTGKANYIRNGIIVELRNRLDKAFLAFYKEKYGEPPIQKNNMPVNVYFPVVPELNGKTVEQRLKDYFHHSLKIKDFSSDFPLLFTYLRSIQPLGNPSYLWLAQLYKLANLHKHDSNELPSIPKIDNVEINMTKFLPEALDGVTKLLLKLFNPQQDIKWVNALRFSCYVPLLLRKNKIEKLAIEQKSSPASKDGASDLHGLSDYYYRY